MPKCLGEKLVRLFKLLFWDCSWGNVYGWNVRNFFHLRLEFYKCVLLHTPLHLANWISFTLFSYHFYCCIPPWHPSVPHKLQPYHLLYHQNIVHSSSSKPSSSIINPSDSNPLGSLFSDVLVGHCSSLYVHWTWPKHFYLPPVIELSYLVYCFSRRESFFPAL